MRRGAERRGLWALLLSLIALIISVASLWEAHQAHLLGLESSSALLEVTAVTADRTFLKQEDLLISIVFTNVGHAAAKKIEVQCTAVFDEKDIRYEAFQPSCHARLEPVGPGRTQTHSFFVHLGGYKPNRSNLIIY